ncbi:MAG TPA: glycine cleavage system aminomethyltransferase GcvT [bacterium]|nr:glycine cleavage system aminomethyltransferase GcvT [bacterium]
MKTTPLNAVHRKLGARMVDFAGWDMPVQYAGVREEHMAVRTRCGIFDVSHMGEIEISGAGALAFVQKVTCNDASHLKPGQSQYSAFLTERGTFVDDVIVNRLADDRFLICVNASNADKDFEWTLRQARTSASVKNVGDQWALIAAQGPEAASVMAKAFRDVLLPQRAFTFLESRIAGMPVLISRTGYTGEDGFEIYAPWNHAEKIWTPLAEAGAVPCGLGARDTLRLEAALPLYGHEIDDQTTPYEAGLGWIVKMEKGDFIGRDTLSSTPVRKRLVGIEMREPGIARQGNDIYHGGNKIGIVTSGTKAPFLDRAIATGFVPPDFAAPGTKLGIDIHNKTRHAEVVSMPFFKRKK